MPIDSEIERFFALYSAKQRKWVEISSEYQIAVKRGKTITALEIAAVIVSSQDPGQCRRDVRLIFKKEFPEIDISN